MATEDIVRDNGIVSFTPACKSKTTFPTSRRTSFGKLLMIVNAFG